MKHTFKKLDLLNITTGRLHTSMDSIYKFFETTIEAGIMTHSLPNARRAILPILQQQLSEDYFQDAYTPTVENIDVEIEISEQDKLDFWGNYESLPSIFTQK